MKEVLTQAYMVTKPDCPFCVKAKDYLRGLGVDCTVDVVGEDVMWDDVLKNIPTGKTTVPQIWMRGQYVGGYDNLTEWALYND